MRSILPIKADSHPYADLGIIRCEQNTSGINGCSTPRSPPENFDVRNFILIVSHHLETFPDYTPIKNSHICSNTCADCRGKGCPSDLGERIPPTAPPIVSE
jgi:hypothetical protein